MNSILSEIQSNLLWKFGIDNPEFSKQDWGNEHRKFREEHLGQDRRHYSKMIKEVHRFKKEPSISTITKWESGARFPDSFYREAIANLVEKYISSKSSTSSENKNLKQEIEMLKDRVSSLENEIHVLKLSSV